MSALDDYVAAMVRAQLPEETQRALAQDLMFYGSCCVFYSKDACGNFIKVDRIPPGSMKIETPLADQR